MDKIIQNGKTPKIKPAKSGKSLKNKPAKSGKNYWLFIENMIIFLAKEKWIYAKIIRKKIV